MPFGRSVDVYHPLLHVTNDSPFVVGTDTLLKARPPRLEMPFMEAARQKPEAVGTDTLLKAGLPRGNCPLWKQPDKHHVGIDMHLSHSRQAA